MNLFFWRHKEPSVLIEQTAERSTETTNHPVAEQRGKRSDERRFFYFHAHGITYGNRQRAIRQCVRGESLQLVREPDNPHDRNAIRILRLNGDDVGYVPKEKAARLAPTIDAGQRVRAEVNWLNPANEEFDHIGLKVRVGVLKEN